MNFNLLGQNLALAVAMLVTGVLVYLAFAPWLLQQQLPKKKKDKAKRKLPKAKIARLLAGAGLSAVLVQGIFSYVFKGEELPTIYLMALPMTLGIAATIWVWGTRKWHNRLLGFSAIICGLLFGLVLVNDYYHYYPTVGDLLNVYANQQIRTINDQTTVRYSNAGVKQSTSASLEQSLENTNVGTLPAQGQVYGVSIPSTVSHFPARKGWLYVPPVAYSPQKIDLPVIVLLAGEPGGPNDWLNGGGAAQTLNAFAAQHHGVAPIVVIVDDLGSQFNDTECVNSTRGNAETYLTVDVPNYLRSNFDVSSNPANWAIGGLSDGGMCGIMLTLRHPDIYHYFLDLGGTLGPSIGSQVTTIAKLFGGSTQEWNEHQPLYLLQHGSFKGSGLGGYFAVGNADSTDVVTAVQTLYQQSTASGLDVAYETTQGRHTFAVWEEQFRDALPWLSYRLGATTCSSQCD